MYVKIWTPWRVDIANDRYKFVNAQLWETLLNHYVYAAHIPKDAQPFANVEIGKTPNYLLMRKVCDEYNIFVTRIPFVNQMVYTAFRFVIMHHSFQTYQETKFKWLNKYSSTFGK